MRNHTLVCIMLLAVVFSLLFFGGQGLAKDCGTCLRALEGGWRYCPYCGARIGGFHLGKGDAGRLLLGVEGPTKKVYREPGTFEGMMESEAKISLARGEYEAVQVVLYPVPRGKVSAGHTYSYSVTDLVGENGRIDKNEISVSPIGYVYPSPQYYGQDYGGAHPDPLWPSPNYRPGTVRARDGELQPLWYLVHATRETPSGDYSGTMTIKEGKGVVAEVRISVHVWDFELPSEMHFPAAFDFYSIKKMYPKRPGEFSENWHRRIMSLKRLYYTDMLEHRVSPMRNLGYPRFLGIKGGEFAFDFNDFDEKYRFYVTRHHQPRFAIAPEWSGWGTPEFEKWKPLGWIGFRNPTSLKATFRAIGNHLEERGWLEGAYIYSIDEHPGKWTKGIDALIHEAHPGLKNLLTIMVQEGYPNVDIWCPRMYELTPERLSLGKKFQRDGKELWIYTSGPTPPFPTLVLDWDLINCRIIPWMCWKFGLDGYLYWCINYWVKNPWETTATYPMQNGGGFLYYPGRNGPVGTLRLEALRDGLEDYEYLWLLKDYLGKVTKKGKEMPPPALEEVKQLLRVDDSVVRYFNDFAYDPKLLYNNREKVAEQIENIKEMLR
jgi:hypothetical protein